MTEFVNQSPIINYEDETEYRKKTEELIQGIDKLKRVDEHGYGIFRFKQDDVILGQLTKRIELLLEDRAAAKSELEQNKSSKEVIEREKEEINENMNQMKTELEKLKIKEGELNDAKKKMETMGKSISELDEAKNNIQQELTKAQYALVDSGKSEEEIQSLKSKLHKMNSLKGDIESLTKSLEECESSKTKCEDEKQTVSNEIIDLRTQFKDQKAVISSKDTQIEELTEGNSKLNEDILEINSKLGVLQQEKDRLEGKNKGLEDENLELTKGNTELEKVNLELKKQKSQLEAQQKAQLEAQKKAEREAQLKLKYEEIKSAIDKKTDELKETMENEYQKLDIEDIEKISPDDYISKTAELAGIIIDFQKKYNIRTLEEIISSSTSPTEKLALKIGIQGETDDQIFKDRFKNDIINDFNNGRPANEKDYSTYMKSKVEEYNIVYDNVISKLREFQNRILEKQQLEMKNAARVKADEELALTNAAAAQEYDQLRDNMKENGFYMVQKDTSNNYIIEKTQIDEENIYESKKGKIINVLIHNRKKEVIGIELTDETFNNIIKRDADNSEYGLKSLKSGMLTINLPDPPDRYNSTIYGAYNYPIYILRKVDKHLFLRKILVTSYKYKYLNDFKEEIGYDSGEDELYISILSKDYINKDEEFDKFVVKEMKQPKIKKKQPKSIEEKINKSNMGQRKEQRRQTSQQQLKKQYVTDRAYGETKQEPLGFGGKSGGSSLSYLEKIVGENKSHDNIMGLRNLTRKNHRGGYRYSDLGMKGLTIVLTDAAPVKKVAKKKSKNKSKKAKGKKGKSGKKMYLGKNTVRRNKGSPKKRKGKK